MRVLLRRFTGAGFPAFLLPLMLIALYIPLYYVLLRYPVWGAYGVVLANFQLLFSLSDGRRNDFMKANFLTVDYYTIRLLENMLVSLGTILLCLFHGRYLAGGLLFLSGFVFLFISTSSFWRRAIPTPFSKKPFEFSIGFRKTWLLLLLLYLLGGIGIMVANINLVLFCLFCICACSMFYYDSPEPLLLHWNQNRRPTSFLWYKIRRGVTQLSLLLGPMLLFLVLMHPSEIWKALLVWGLGLLPISFMICLKYAVYPRKISAPEASVVALCLVFYPLILAVIPYYYIKALQNLKHLS